MADCIFLLLLVVLILACKATGFGPFLVFFQWLLEMFVGYHGHVKLCSNYREICVKKVRMEKEQEVASYYKAPGLFNSSSAALWNNDFDTKGFSITVSECFSPN